MTREEQIELLNTVKDKTLSRGCYVRYKGFLWDDIILGELRQVGGDVFDVPETNFGGMGAYKSNGKYVVFTDKEVMEGHMRRREEYERECNSEGIFALYVLIDSGDIIGHSFYIGHAINWIENNVSDLGFIQERFLTKLQYLYKDKTKDIEVKINSEALRFFTSLVKVYEEQK